MKEMVKKSYLPNSLRKILGASSDILVLLINQDLPIFALSPAPVLLAHC